MDRITTISLLTLALLSRTRTAPSTDFIPDEENAEIAVPRSPSVKGPHIEYLTFIVGTKLKNLTCEVDGTPVPKVVWLRNGMGVQQLNQPLEVEFYPDENLSVLFLPDIDLSEDSEKMLPGNYTCVAANFLGRASKTYIVTLMEISTTISTMPTASVKTEETTTTVTTLSP